MDQRPVAEIIEDMKLDIWKDSGDEQSSLTRCTQYISGLCDPGVRVVKSWHVRTINEWNVEQDRVLVLTSTHIYRVSYDAKYGRIQGYKKMAMEKIINVLVDPARPDGMKLLTQEDDMQKNMFSMFASKKPASSFEPIFERIYYVTMPANFRKLLPVFLQSRISLTGADISCCATVKLVKTTLADQLGGGNTWSIDGAIKYIQIYISSSR